jgi:hypothetical protein
MIFCLTILLRVAGAGLLLLALAHIPIGRRLRWREDVVRMAPVNASIFHVHTLFICVMLVMMALPCLCDPHVFLEKSRAGAWLAWSFAGFWAVRLFCQWFVYPPSLWRGKRFETFIHFGFTLIWFSLTALFAACGAWQAGWLSP